jgi:hypothetical protein
MREDFKKYPKILLGLFRRPQNKRLQIFREPSEKSSKKNTRKAFKKYQNINKRHIFFYSTPN